MDVLSQLVTAMSVGRPQAFVIECHSPWGRRYAPVPGAGVHVVLTGAATLIRPDAPPLRISVGDVVLLPTGIGHGLASGSDVRLIPVDHQPVDAQGLAAPVVLGPDGAAIGETASMLCGTYLFDSQREHPVMHRLPPVVYLPARLGEQSELSAVVSLLGRELTRTVAGRQLAVESLLDLLLVTVLRTWHEQHPSDGWAAALHDAAIADALHHIHADPAHPWTVAELGARVGLSRAPFAKRFTLLVGRPPLTYLTWWRMTLAARLLQDGERVLADIAGRVGYASPYAFAHAFKRVHGVSPGRYRSTAFAKALTVNDTDRSGRGIARGRSGR